MADTKIATRLYLPAALAEGGAVALDAGRSHRLRNVLRLGPGAMVAGFNARDGEFRCRIVELGRDRGLLAVEACLRAAEPETGPWLLFAPVKKWRLEWLVEKGTELGVAAFIPVTTARTQPDRLNRERLLAHAIAAVEQCERLSVPEIRPLLPLAQVLAEWSAECALILCDESGGGAPIGEVMAGLPAGEPAALLVGPEGGFAQTELDALANLPFVKRAGLGPRVLRAETAALAALVAYQTIAGDWRKLRRR